MAMAKIKRMIKRRKTSMRLRAVPPPKVAPPAGANGPLGNIIAMAKIKKMVRRRRSMKAAAAAEPIRRKPDHLITLLNIRKAKRIFGGKLAAKPKPPTPPPPTKWSRMEDICRYWQGVGLLHAKRTQANDWIGYPFNPNDPVYKATIKWRNEQHWRPRSREDDYYEQLVNPSKVGDPNQIARQAANELEKRLGTKPLPKLHCFTMNLTGDSSDPDEVLRQADAKKRENERRVYIHKLRHMYQLALANKATSQRILDKHGELENPLDNTSVDDLTSNLAMLFTYGGEDDEEDDRPWTKHLRGAIVPIEELEEHPHQPLPPSTDTTIAIKTTTRALKTRKNTIKMKALPAPPLAPPPLSINSIAAPRIIEAKCMSTLWTNYMKERPDGGTVE